MAYEVTPNLMCARYSPNVGLRNFDSMIYLMASVAFLGIGDSGT